MPGDPVIPAIDSYVSKLALRVGTVLYRGDPLLVRGAQMINDIIWLGETTHGDAVRFLDTSVVDLMDILLSADNDSAAEEQTDQ
jgi:hypothetical protein